MLAYRGLVPRVIRVLAMLAASSALAIDIVASSTAVTVPEGGSQTFTVALSAQPTSDVVVSVARASGDADVTVASPTPRWSVPAGQSPDSVRAPEGVAVDASGNLFVADTRNHRLLRRATTGVWSVFGGYGTLAGQFKLPAGVAVDSAGCLYVADTGNNRIQKRETDGSWTMWGSLGTAIGQFSQPGGVAADSAGNVYVSDTGNSRIQRRDTAGTWTLLASYGTDEGGFSTPRGLAIGPDGSLYVIDSYTCYLQRRTPAGAWTIVAGGDGTALGLFSQPRGVAVDADGTIYVADTNNHRIQRRSTSGTWTAWGSRGTAAGQFYGPCGVAVASDGVVYVADTNAHRLQRRETNGDWSVFGSAGDAAGQFSGPCGVAVDASGTVYVADTSNNRVQRRDASGVWDVLSTSGAGVGQVTAPSGVAVDSAGNLYVADTGNSRIQRRTTAGTWTVLGTSGSAVGQFASPWSVAIGPADRLWVADTFNNRLQYTDPGGSWQVVGSAGSAAGQFASPIGVSADAAGNIYVADTSNSRVQKRDSGGTWTVLGTSGSAAGQFSGPTGAAADAAGVVYTTETVNNDRVQKRDAGGNWSVIGTTGSAVGQFTHAYGAAVDPAGYLYVADAGNSRIQRLCPGLVFTPDNWNVPQIVTLAAAEDADAVDGTTGIVCEASGLTAAEVTATEADNDRRIVVSTNAVTVPEGGTATFTVALAGQPASSVEVAIARTSGDADIDTKIWSNPTFTTANWNTPQTITLTAATDVDQVNGQANIRCSADGWASADVTATEGDTTQALVVSPSAVTVPEGGSQTFTVALPAQPSSDVTVSVCRLSGDTDLTVASPGEAWVVWGSHGVAAGQFDYPVAVTTDAAGNVYVAEYHNERVQMRSAAGAWTAMGSDGTGLGQFHIALGVAVDGSGNLYVADYGNSRVQMRDAGGNWSLVGGPGTALGQFGYPCSVAVDAAGNLYVAESGGNRVQRRDTSGTWTVLASATVYGAPGALACPTSLAVDAAGNLYVADTDNHRIQRRDTAGNWTAFGSQGTGLGLLFYPRAVGVGENGSVYVGDTRNGVQRRDADGTWTVVCPQGINPGQVGEVRGLTLDAAGNLIVSDTGNDRIQKRCAGLTFTAANWNVPQTVTLAAAEDDDMADGQAVFRCEANGLASADVTATEADNDARLIVSATDVTVPEGGTQTFTVALGGQPAGDVTVTSSWLSGDGDLSVSGGGSLTFTSANWATPQTVTVAAAEDADSANGSAVIRCAAAGLTGADVTATEADNDRLIVTPTDVTVPEGGTQTFQVSLASAPAGDVVVNARWLSGDPDITVSSPGALWSVIAPSGSGLGQVNVPFGMSFDAAGNLYVADKMNYRIQRRDTNGVWTAWGSQGTDPGQFTEPTGAAADAAGNIYVADKGNNRIQMRATDGSWTVWGGLGYGNQPGQFCDPYGVAADAAGRVYVADTDNDRIQKRDTDGTWTTWGSTFGRPELRQPTGVAVNSANVVYAVEYSGTRIQWGTMGGQWFASGPATSGTAPGQFTFPMGIALDPSGQVYVADRDNHRVQKRDTSGTWTVYGSHGTGLGQFELPSGIAADSNGIIYVADSGNSRIQMRSPAGLTFTPANWNVPQTVTLAAAEDADAIDGQAIIRCEATGWAPADVTATEADNDRRIVVTPTSVSVPEAGTQTFTVALGGQPAADVTVSVARTAGDTDLTVTGGASLTFTSANWDTPQTVTLAAAADTDAVNGTATITASATGWAPADVAATEADDDQSLVVTPTAVTVPEGGTQTFTVALAGQPAADVTVSVARSSGDTDLTVSSGASLTFTSANWDTPQTVTLAAAADTDAVNGTATITASATGWAPADVTATEADDDQSLVVTPTSVTVPEGGTQTFNVALAGQPAADVSVSVARTAGDNDLSVSSGASLTFTSANWATPQTVTLAAAADTDAVNGTATFTASATGWTSADVTATEADDDVYLMVAPTSVTVPEGGTQTFTVALAGQPAADVTVSVARTAGDTDLTVSSGASLTFTSANWSTPQTVTVAAAADADALNGTATFTASATGWTWADVTATEADDDKRIVATPSSLTVPENGTRTFSVQLAGQPAADVVVATGRVRGDNSLRVSAGSSLTFTPANWNVPQLVTLTALDDVDTVNGEATFRAAATGWVSADVVATEADDDLRVLAAPAAVAVPEGGTNTFSVRLAGQPAANVVVSAGRQSGDASLRVSAGGSLTFTRANWNIAQLVTLTALEDIDTINGQATFRLSAAGWPSLDVVANEVDNDLRLIATPLSLTVPEGGTNTFSVRLAGQPAGNVVVSAGRQSGDSSLRVSAGGSLTFTPANWNVPQLVTVQALEDSDTLNGQATFRLSAAGWPSLDVTATEIDNDLRLIATPTSLTVPEGGTKTFSVRLAGQPAGNVVVSAGRQSGDSSLRVSAGGSLTFTPTNWNVAQIVTIYALPDSDTVNGQATFRASLSGWQSVDVVATEQEPSTSASPAPDGGS